MKPNNTINRRDFVNGCALSLAAGTSLSPLEAIAQDLLDPTALPPDYYPPTRQGTVSYTHLTLPTNREV